MNFPGKVLFILQDLLNPGLFWQPSPVHQDWMFLLGPQTPDMWPYKVPRAQEMLDE